MKITTPKKGEFTPTPNLTPRTFTLTQEQIKFLATYSNASEVIRQLIDSVMKEGADNVSL